MDNKERKAYKRRELSTAEKIKILNSLVGIAKGSDVDPDDIKASRLAKYINELEKETNEN